MKSIEYNKKAVDEVISGQICEVAIQLPPDFERHYINDGTILCDPEYPLFTVRKFKAIVLIFEVQYPVTKGTEVVVHAFSAKIPG